MKTLIWEPEGAPAFLAIRSQRLLRGLGLESCVVRQAELAGRIGTGAFEGPLLVLKAGSWFVDGKFPEAPPGSATGLGVCAVAASIPAKPGADNWAGLLAGIGGSSKGSEATIRGLGLPDALLLDGKLLGELRAAAQGGKSLVELLIECCDRFRLVSWPDATVAFDGLMRVLQAVTSIQFGGAERIALSLTHELARSGVNVRLAAPFRPTRTAFETPREWLDLEKLRRRGESSLEAILRVAPSFDLLHLHLFKGDEMERFAATGVPCVTTIHNSRDGWPDGLEKTGGAGSGLLLACSLEVEQALLDAKVSVPVRTVWNGIDVHAFRRTGETDAERLRWRRRWGFGDDDLVLMAVANPRPQKRLHLLPAVLAEVRDRFARTREVRLVFAGQASASLSDSVASEAAIHQEVDRLGLGDHVRFCGAVAGMPGFLAAGDGLVSFSTHEGLSLSHLEALAMERPVVCTATAGSQEMAAANPAVRVVPLDATPVQFAGAVVSALEADPASGRAAVCERFTMERMAERTLMLYRRLLRRPPGKPAGLWLITNNFSMGGAQTSARRLLGHLAAEGVPVRVAVIQENVEHPTTGTTALRTAGIEVRAFGPHRSRAELRLADELLEAIEADPPVAVVFWNLIPVYKLLLADALVGTRLIDVSPGEMFFQSFETYFANPHPGLPYLGVADYGRRLSGVVVKYSAEAPRAAELGSPVHVIPNGVPLPAERLPGRRAPDRLILGTAARVHPQKRLEDLIAALHKAKDRLPPCEFRIAGGVEAGCGDYFHGLQTLAMGLPVRWLGELPDTAEFLAGLDIFLMISEPAGCPNALLEALACGLPTIATDAGGAGEQVIDGVTGRLVPARDVDAFAEALVGLAAQPLTWPAYSAAARQHIAEQFSMERMAAGYRRICFGSGSN